MKYILTIIAIAALPACTLTIDPDGTKTVGVDGEAAGQIITDILNEK